MTVPHVSVDRSRSILDDPTAGHNRWHPDIEPIAMISPGEEIVIECRDGFDGQVTHETTSSDLSAFDFESNHPLTGPIAVAGAEPGDVLAIELVEIVPGDFGSTVLGLPDWGVLSDDLAEPYLVRWDLNDGVARSSDLPGITIKGAPFLGIVGVAPSRDFLAVATEREQRLAATGAAVKLPDPKSAIPAREPIASSGLRTLPPRENGGNLDVKQLAMLGARVLLPVQVEGGLVSVGDPHFAQGDGEACATAIEMSAEVTLRIDLRKRDSLSWTPRTPMYELPRSSDPYRGGSACIATTGLPLRSDGTNASMDVRLAIRNAVIEMIDYLGATRGLSREQAYVLISVAGDIHISEAVDIPNPLVSVILPLDIFGQ